MSSQKKNPLYVVTNEGKDVEMTFSNFEAWMKKWGLEEYWKLLKSCYQQLLLLIKEYSSLEAWQHLWDDIQRRLKKLDELFALLDRVAQQGF